MFHNQHELNMVTKNIPGARTVALFPPIYFTTFAYSKEGGNNVEANQICQGECLHLDRDSDQRS